MKLRLLVPLGAIVELVAVPPGTNPAVMLLPDEPHDGDPTPPLARGNIEAALSAVYQALPDVQQTPSAEATTAVIGFLFDLGFVVIDPSTEGRVAPLPASAMPTEANMRDALAVAFELDGLPLPVPDEALAALVQSLDAQGYIEHDTGDVQG